MSGASPYSVSGGMIFKDAPEKKYTRRSCMVMNSGKVVEQLNLRRLTAATEKADRLAEKLAKEKTVAKLKAKSWKALEAESLALYEAAAAGAGLGEEEDEEEAEGEDSQQQAQEEGEGEKGVGAEAAGVPSETGVHAAGCPAATSSSSLLDESARTALLQAQLQAAMEGQRRQNKEVLLTRRAAASGPMGLR